MDTPTIERIETRLGPRWPHRIGSKFFIPTGGDLRMLAGGRQFLFQDHRLSSRSRAFFGGIDEMPFASHVTADAFNASLVSEASFYEALKPVPVKLAEKKGVKPKRQGDYFMIPVAPSWEALLTCKPPGFSFAHFGKQEPSEYSGVIYESNHTISGLHVIGQIYGTAAVIVSGTMSARDHKPVELVEPHALVRATNLVDSPEED